MWFKKKEQTGNYHEFKDLIIHHHHLLNAFNAGFLEETSGEYSCDKSYKKGNFIYRYNCGLETSSITILMENNNDTLEILSIDDSIVRVFFDITYEIESFYDVKVLNKSLIDAALNMTKEIIKVANNYKKEKTIKEFIAQQEKEAKFAKILINNE
jgi:hypothetical protein